MEGSYFVDGMLLNKTISSAEDYTYIFNSALTIFMVGLLQT